MASITKENIYNVIVDHSNGEQFGTGDIAKWLGVRNSGCIYNHVKQFCKEKVLVNTTPEKQYMNYYILNTKAKVPKFEKVGRKVPKKRTFRKAETTFLVMIEVTGDNVSALTKLGNVKNIDVI